MGAITDFLGLVKPGGGSTGLITPPERVDIDVLNDNFQKIDDWAEIIGNRANRNFNFRGPAGSLSGLTGMVRGDSYRETDGNFVLWVYDGANWVTGEQGLYLIRPASVGGTGVTIAADGSVAFAANTPQVQINGCFSSRFRRYRVMVDVTSASSNADVYFAFRNAGSAVGAGAAFWVRQLNDVGGGPTRSVGQSQDHIAGPVIGADGGYVTYEFSNPGHAVRKFFSTESFSSDVGHRIGGGQIILNSAADGFSFGTQTAVTITGSLKVYGYA